MNKNVLGIICSVIMAGVCLSASADIDYTITLDKRMSSCMHALADTLHKINNKASAKKQECKLRELYKELDEIQREMMRLDCPSDPQLAETCSEKLLQSMENDSYFDEIDRLKKVGFYKLKTYEESPEGLDILRPMTCYINMWGKVARELEMISEVEAKHVERYGQAIKQMQELEDALREVGHADTEQLNKIKHLSLGLDLSVIDELKERSEKERKTYLTYYFRKASQTWIDLHDQFVLLYAEEYLNHQGIRDTMKHMEELSRVDVGKYYTDFDGHMKERARLLRLKCKGVFYRQ